MPPARTSTDSLRWYDASTSQSNLRRGGLHTLRVVAVRKTAILSAFLAILPVGTIAANPQVAQQAQAGAMVAPASISGSEVDPLKMAAPTPTVGAKSAAQA